MVKLIVFDFHKTLSLKSGKVDRIFSQMFEEYLEKGEKKDFLQIGINDLKNVLRVVKKTTWYEAMKELKIDPYIMMPTLNDIILFVEYMKELNAETVFGIASMLEDEQFMYDMLKYCFEERGKISPFTHKTIVSSSGLKEFNIKSLSQDDKWPHISVILQRNKLNIDKEDIVLIDDDVGVLDHMSKIICVVKAEEYFTIEDWNKGCYSKV